MMDYSPPVAELGLSGVETKTQPSKWAVSEVVEAKASSKH
jgi:hypothetical protein